jgi:hypothetical protein
VECPSRTSPTTPDKNSNVTRTVYRHNISPTVTAAKGVMQNLFAAKEETG